MFTVKLIHRDSGRPIRGSRVSIKHGFVSLLGPARTDVSGNVHFDHAPVTGRAIINGTIHDEVLRFQGRVVIYV